MRALCPTHLIWIHFVTANNIWGGVYIMKLLIIKFFTLLLIRLYWAQISFLLSHFRTYAAYILACIWKAKFHTHTCKAADKTIHTVEFVYPDSQLPTKTGHTQFMKFYWTTARFPKQNDTLLKTRTCLDVRLFEFNISLIKHCTCISLSGSTT